MSETDDALTELERLRAAGTPCALVTVVRAIAPTSGKPGQKAVVTADGRIHGWIGGGCAQPAVTKSVAEALEDGEPRLIRVAPPECAEKGQPGVVDFNMGCASRGTLDLFIEPMQPRPVVRIHGSAPSARHIADLAARVGFEVQVLAPGTEPGDFPNVTRHAARYDGGEDWPAPNWAVVATQGQGDRKALTAALESPAAAIAFIASRRKRAHQVEHFSGKGYAEERLAAIHAPAGVDIGAKIPEEIALSVVAQLVEWRRRGAGAVSSEASPAATDRVDHGN
ncbi:XdhC family protein [Halofilum ochraceum]|uniref:XdhC family protein n=1 Tax=Halofilum ochraceum TaxID=1611323 RepID=UPI00083004DD|nr:XdhC family protein [Halofilum ochraceum]